MLVNDFIIKNNNNRIVKYKSKLYGFNINKITKKHIFHIAKTQVVNIGAFFNKKIVIDFKKFKSFIDKHKIIEVTDIILKGNKIESIKADLYNIKCISLKKEGKNILSVFKVKPNSISSKFGGNPLLGVNGVFSYDVWKLNIEGTSLKNIMFIGELHGEQDHCTNNYIDMYNTLINDINKNEINVSIDIFYEQDPDAICIQPYFMDCKNWINKLRIILHPYANYHYLKKSLLRVHWTDPQNKYDISSLYPNNPADPVMFNKAFIKALKELIGLSATNLSYNELSKKCFLLFNVIKSKEDLNKLILFNKKIKVQARKSILSEKQYNSFINHIVDIICIKFNITDDNWYHEGIFRIQRLSVEFYAFFRMLRKVDSKLKIKNAIFHAGQNHTERLKIIFNEFKVLYPNTLIEYIEQKSIPTIDPKNCLDFSFNTFIEAAKTTYDPLEEQEIRKEQKTLEEQQALKKQEEEKEPLYKVEKIIDYPKIINESELSYEIKNNKIDLINKTFKEKNLDITIKISNGKYIYEPYSNDFKSLKRSKLPSDSIDTIIKTLDIFTIR